MIEYQERLFRWALRQFGMEEWLVQTVMTMYERARTVVRTKQGYSTEFEVKVGGPPRISTQSTTFCSCDGSSDLRSKGRITMGNCCMQMTWF